MARPQGLSKIFEFDLYILIQAENKEVVEKRLTQLIEHMKEKGWEINPDKIQGPAQSVKFLGIIWNKGHREILPKAKQKILDFSPPRDKREAQKFVGLFGFWRNHIPHLGQILKPLYKVTRKKYAFEWGETESKAFEEAKIAIQTALDLWPVQPGPMELQVTVLHGYADWSLWQKQQGRNVPLGFWSRKLPPAGQNYTPFEQQLLAAYWALVETEHLTLNHEVVLRPAIPIMSWIMGTPASHKIGHAQESSIIKWKWYLQNRVKTGRSGVSTLHEKVLELPKHSNDIDIPPKSYDQSPVSWNNGYDSLTPEQKKHAWFTDGSAKYIGSKRCWKAVAYNPSCNTILESSGEGQSSQWAELVAVYQVIQKEQGGQCYIYILIPGP